MPKKLFNDYDIQDAFMGIDEDMDISKEFADAVDDGFEMPYKESDDPISHFYTDWKKRKFS